MNLMNTLKKKSGIDPDQNPFTEVKEHPVLKVVKERNLYKYQAPSNHIVSPHKPVLQTKDLSVLKVYFDICIGNYINEVPESTYLEFQNYMSDQKQYKQIIELMEFFEEKLFDKAVVLPTNTNSFIDFVKSTMIDFILDCTRPGLFYNYDEQSIYCEVFFPIFKAFGNCSRSLTYAWCERKAKDSDHVWLVSNNFNKEKENNLKLLDGVGQMTVNNIMNYLLLESSG
ncbi:unnamed protein product [Mucor hiemalis]